MSRLKPWVADALPVAERRMHVAADQFLGGGSYGQAFLTNKGTVLKLTVDKSEAAAVKLVNALRAKGSKLRGLVHFPGNPVKLGNAKDGAFGIFTAWAIAKRPVRELSDSELDRFTEVPRTSLPMFRSTRPVSGVKGRSTDTVWHHATEAALAWRKARTAPMKRALFREYVGWLELARRAPTTRHIADTLLSLAKEGHLIVDAIPHNFGRTPSGELVAFDFGVVPFE